MFPDQSNLIGWELMIDGSIYILTPPQFNSFILLKNCDQFAIYQCQVRGCVGNSYKLPPISKHHDILLDKMSDASDKADEVVTCGFLSPGF